MRNPDSIPRYELPDYVQEAQHPTGSCWNCGHMCEVFIDRLTRTLCAADRDDGSFGELREASPDIHDCERWVDYDL